MAVSVALAALNVDLIRHLWDRPLSIRSSGDSRYNLSTLDLLLNCSPKARDIIAGGS